MTGPDANHPERGISIIEMLVVLSILSLVSLTIVAALRTGSRTYEAAVRTSTSAQTIEGASARLRQLLSHAYPLKIDRNGAILFEGRESDVTFAGLLPEAARVPGWHVMTLRVDDSTLFLVTRPLRGGATIRTRLMEQVERVSFRYVYRDGREDGLPSLIDMDIWRKNAEGEPTSLRIRPRITEQTHG